MTPDQRLDQLFAAARRQPAELPSDYGFQTRLLAAMREMRHPQTALGRFSWQLLPAFAAITLAAIFWSDRLSTGTHLADLLGSPMGESALVDYLVSN